MANHVEISIRAILLKYPTLENNVDARDVTNCLRITATLTRVQILDVSVCVSIYANNLNPSLLVGFLYLMAYKSP